MAYNNPFLFLGPKVVFYLSRPENLLVRELYIDSLAVLQALLGRFASGPNASTIDDPHLVERVIDENITKIAALIVVPPSVDPSAPDSSDAQATRDISTKTLALNKETAVDLYAECVNPTNVQSHQVAFDLADKYIRALVEQYTFFRYPNRQPIEEPEKAHTAAA
jgi:hypothetical protein